jgi:4-hydroxyphenylpyruvate dioxygenase-like putative hemolysin
MTDPLFTDVVQIGIVVRSVSEAVKKYRELMGIGDWHFNEVDTLKGKGTRFRVRGTASEVRAMIAWTQLGNVELELIEPRDEESVYAEFLRDKGPGVHHVMFATEDYDVCRDRMNAQGVEPLASGEVQKTRFCLLDTLEALGVVSEIADGEPLVPDHSEQ